MMATEEKSWVWKRVGIYDRLTSAEVGLYYERYHDLLDLVVVRCQVRAGDRVLDIGTGTGELARRFAQNRGCRVTGLDPSEVMIEAARRKASDGLWGEVSFQVADAPFLEITYPDGAFDAVASTQAFHHLHERHKAAAVREMARVLRSPGTAEGRGGGWLAIGDPMFQDRGALEAALARWPEDLEEEYFAYLETLEPIFSDAGLSYHAERVSRINWVVWGQRQNEHD
jgi:ubiquinone/menaquinone biosynthesis C-methylase UbiE